VSGSTIRVQLNQGYGYAPAETWGTGQINDGQSANVGFGAGWATAGNVFSGGVNLSLAVNDVKSRLMDMNSDGLPDYVSATSDGLRVALNNGGGFAPAVPWGQPLKSLGEDGIATLGSYGGLKLPFGSRYTLNDGLSTSATISVTGTVPHTVWATFVPVVDIVVSGGASKGETISQPSISYMDVNGDGLVDSVRSGDGNTLEVLLNRIGKTNLLKTVRRPLGARIELDYARDGNTYEQPHSKWVMSELRVHDGASNDTPAAWKSKGSDWQRSSYAYAGGNYDRHERDFLGYARVTSTQHDTGGKDAAGLASAPLYRKTEQTYANTS
ncbi:toxin TcdB middle/N-terminal domain-containing protein, partial [Leptospira sp. SA-E8]|uniref:toxin TcdB middle/N-terminal domain-containing protein n=1 Tax=Leptospira sp. SA-E8 TaxID=3422259 RepID=UPI003EB82A07